MCLASNFFKIYFHQLGPLGRVSLVVAKSVCVLFACCFCVCPLPMRFFCVVGLVRSVPRPWTGGDLDLDLDLNLNLNLDLDLDLHLDLK